MLQSENKQSWQKWFENVWKHREEAIFPLLFGQRHRGIFPIKAEMLTGMFKQESFDPRWLFFGVFEFAPTSTRNSWLYVTSGMSNDWEADQPDPSTPSGLGCEFLFETVQQSDWAILRLLQLMTFQILLCHKRFPGRGPLGDFDRLPLRSPICPGHSLLTYLMLAPPAQFPREVRLESGPFNFYQAVGISETEAAYARSHNGAALLELLIAHNYYPVTNPGRKEVIVQT